MPPAADQPHRSTHQPFPEKQRDDFRLLSQGIKNITVLTYDELLTRLNNYIRVLEEFAASAPAKAKKGKAKTKARA